MEKKGSKDFMEFSVGMALVDYIPVVCFLAAAIVLQRDLYNKMSKGAFALFAAGTIDVFMAGVLKATYKLLYASGVCNFAALSQLFFPVQAIGFVLAGAGLTAMICHKQTGDVKVMGFAPILPVVLAAAVTSEMAEPALFSGTMIFVVLMVLGLLCMDVSLCIVSKRIGKPGIMVWFIVSFVFCLGMGYLSSKNFEKASMNWIAEGVNCVGQAALLVGALKLHRAGLAEKSIAKS